MDKDILQYINENKTELKRQTHYRDESNELLGNQDVSDYIRKNAEKKYTRACQKIEEIKEKLNKDGLRDRVIEKIKTMTHKTLELQKDEENKRDIKLAEKARKQGIRDTYYTNLRAACKYVREDRYQVRRSERWLRKTESYFPAWKKKKLDNMPNNKGYIWRGIHYYGARPPNTREPVILFEQKGQILLIHEITSTYHKVFQKATRNSKKKLIKNTSRRNPYLNKNTLDKYIKFKK